MRAALAVTLFAAVAAFVVVSEPTDISAQDKKTEKKAKQKVDPKTFIPDAATLKTIKDKTEELRKAIAALKAKKVPDDVLIEVEIYLKAAENIVRFEEWLAAASVKWALTTLDQGLARAKQAEGGKAVWRDAPGKWVLRAYRSEIDDSIQPYAVLLPADYGKDPKKKWRLDVVLHGRDSSLTEAKFIATHNGSAPKDLGYVQLEVYGRGNNAYRWSGETDVWEAVGAFADGQIDPTRVVLRGFSMGGAGTWHIGLHHPSRFCVIGPGAGFTTTHGYIANLPKELPDYQEKCLRIYDAYLYAENAFNVPVVAYSGEKDAQKKAADNIESALKNFKEPLRFTHLVAPGLEHQMPKEWQGKAEAEYRRFADKGRGAPERVRFVTFTPRYPGEEVAAVTALERTYEKAVMEATSKGGAVDIRTSNVRELILLGEKVVDGEGVRTVGRPATVDGQKLDGELALERLVKVDGKWERRGHVIRLFGARSREFPGIKDSYQAGPIDDAFTSRFSTFAPEREGWHAGPSKWVVSRLAEFEQVWDRYFRAKMPTDKKFVYGKEYRVTEETPGNLVLFGDPQSNPLIAKVLPDLPITWTKEKLTVDGVDYDAKTHLPVLIYPCRHHHSRYVVVNSGHTFREADLKGTNALLYPRLGDWAVIKPTPTAKDPAAYEVVAAGLFDENWQFPKKK